MLRRSRSLVAGASAAAILVTLGLGTTASPAGAQNSGAINVSGSSTVEPLSSLVAELFSKQNPDVSVRVDGPGTGDGFKLFCNDETDISDASRPIKPEEASACQSKGITYTELPVAIDGLTIVVNKSSKLKCLSQQDLYAIFGPESGSGTVNLSDASALAQELGSKEPLPSSGSLKKFTPGPESGTYDSFIELGYQSIIDSRISSGKFETTTDDKGKTVPKEPLISAGQFPNDNDTVKRVEGSKNGIGFFGYAYWKENKSGLKDVAVENSKTGECVKPTDSSIKSGDYPMSRTLFIYPNNAKVQSNGAVKSFVDFYLKSKNLNATVKQSGYVPLAKSAQKDSISTWKSAIG